MDPLKAQDPQPTNCKSGNPRAMGIGMMVGSLLTGVIGVLSVMGIIELHTRYGAPIGPDGGVTVIGLSIVMLLAGLSLFRRASQAK